MGLGYCEAGNTEGEGDDFIVPNFKKVIAVDRAVVAKRQADELEVMLSEARKNMRAETYYSLKSVAATLGCNRSTLRKWLSRNGFKAELQRTADSNHQLTLTLKKDQVQKVMNLKII